MYPRTEGVNFVLPPTLVTHSHQPRLLHGHSSHPRLVIPPPGHYITCATPTLSPSPVPSPIPFPITIPIPSHSQVAPAGLTKGPVSCQLMSTICQAAAAAARPSLIPGRASILFDEYFDNDEL
ncbi:hypothetical protein E2C01_007568 [Portunus trituberculatus]|uniref:Uncharacterized protein n=1 Tax=Portunus trituberculatus TaxID=210409 RepID=A0A5B7D4I6_PORTR|nr:hypothetical protein [Portunus trituberculatus]